MSLDYRGLLKDWKRRIEINQQAHYLAATRYNKYHYWIGFPAIILATIAGATLLAEAKEPWIRVSVGIVGLIAAVLSAIQTFYSHAKRAEAHRSVASRLGQVKREIEILESMSPPKKSEQARIVQQINERLSEIDKEAPVVDFSSVDITLLNIEESEEHHLMDKTLSPLLAPYED
ncbi:MAG: DUF4231 domain-containing protein [Anaerolineae bacterium]|nr:DUF4231 domain-containing protein [Anaerolineae bacterium]